MSCFIDTNIFVYEIDVKNPNKQKVAHNFLKSCRADSTFVSTQVLQEFYNAATTKLNVEKQDAKNFVKVAACYNVVQISVATIFSAIDINTRYQFSIWDSLILASAIESGCDTLYTEDLNNGQVVKGVKIINPFSA